MPKQPFLFKFDEGLIIWMREQAAKENRSVNNWTETKLMELKSAGDKLQIIPVVKPTKDANG